MSNVFLCCCLLHQCRTEQICTCWPEEIRSLDPRLSNFSCSLHYCEAGKNWEVQQFLNAKSCAKQFEVLNRFFWDKQICQISSRLGQPAREKSNLFVGTTSSRKAQLSQIDTGILEMKESLLTCLTSSAEHRLLATPLLVLRILGFRPCTLKDKCCCAQTFAALLFISVFGGYQSFAQMKVFHDITLNTVSVMKCGTHLVFR